MNNEFKEIMDIVKENGEMHGRIEAVKAYVNHSKYSVDNDTILAMLGAVTPTMISKELEDLKKAMEDMGVCVAVGDLTDGVLEAIFGNVTADDEKEEAQHMSETEEDSCDGDCSDCDCEKSCYDCGSFDAVNVAKPEQVGEEKSCDCNLPRGCEDCCPSV